MSCIRICPKCNHPVDCGDYECPLCGVRFTAFAEDKDELEDHDGHPVNPFCEAT